MQKYEYKPAFAGVVLYFCPIFIHRLPVHFFGMFLQKEKERYNTI